MKNFPILFAALLTIGLTARAADGDEFTVDNLQYRVLSETEHEVSIVGYVDEPAGELLISEYVNNNGTRYSVTEIGSYSFDECRGLTAVTIPGSVTRIGDHAFAWCSCLTAVTIPGSVTRIGDHAFAWCSCLTAVTIPKSVTDLGERAFGDCTSLQEIIAEEGNSNYTSIDGVLYNSQVTLLIIYPAGKEGAFEIPGSVTHIGPYAFARCSGLTAVAIPNSVTVIEEDAFSGCSGLTTVTIPKSVTHIGPYAFSNCTGLTTIVARPATPPICYSNMHEANTFLSVPQSAVVYIPKGTFKEYSTAEGWKYFYDFRETEDSGIEGVESYSDNASAEFFRLNGMRVKGGALAPGVYLKRRGGNVTKVPVK